MARPKRKGLTYYPHDVDFYSDEKIFALMDEYGPLGSTVYECILGLVYRSGYYLEIPIERLANMLTRTIGSRWISGREQLTGIITYCGRLGLLDEDLLWQGIVTSKAIQRRYEQVTARRKKGEREYWLLSDQGDNETETGVSDAETYIPAPETPVIDDRWYTNKTTQNQTTENERKRKESKPDQTEACPPEGGRLGLCPEARKEFELRIKPIGDSDLLRLDGLCRRYGEPQVILAIRAAGSKNARTINYVQKVLEGCCPDVAKREEKPRMDSRPPERGVSFADMDPQDFWEEFGEVATAVRGGEIVPVYTEKQYRMIEEVMEEGAYSSLTEDNGSD